MDTIHMSMGLLARSIIDTDLGLMHVESEPGFVRCFFDFEFPKTWRDRLELSCTEIWNVPCGKITPYPWFESPMEHFSFSRRLPNTEEAFWTHGSTAYNSLWSSAHGNFTINEALMYGTSTDYEVMLIKCFCLIEQRADFRSWRSELSYWHIVKTLLPISRTYHPCNLIHFTFYHAEF